MSSRIKRINGYFALILGLLAFGHLRVASAQNPETVSILGLTIPCHGCGVVRAEPCMVVAPPSTEPRDCTSELPRLLAAIDPSTYVGLAPSIIEVRDYLFRDEGVPEVKLTLLGLLIQTEPGSELVARDAAVYLSSYPGELYELVLQGRGTTQLIKALWKAATAKGVNSSSGFLAALAGRIPDIQIDDLFARLKTQAVSTPADLDAVESAYRRLGQLALADKVNDGKNILEVCREDVKKCDSVALRNLPGAFGEYLRQLNQDALTQGVGQTARDPSAVIDHLIGLGTKVLLGDKNYRSLLVDALKSVQLSRFPGARSKLIRDEKLSVLTDVSKNDPHVALPFAAVLAKTAEEAAIGGEPGIALDLLRRSLEVYPGDVADRNESVAMLNTSVSIRSNPALSKEFDRIVSGTSIDLPKQTPIAIKVLLFVISICVPLLLWMLVTIIWRRVREDKEEQKAEAEMAQWRAKREERELRSFFRLNEHSTIEDLHRAYRRIAKAAHPDSAGIKPKFDFRELQAKYERAKEILFQPKEIESGEEVDED